MNYKQTLFIGVLCILIGAIIGFALKPSKTYTVGGSNAVGTTFNTPKVANIVFSPTAVGATTTSILNTDSNDRIIQSAHYACTGLGTSAVVNSGALLPNLIFTAATTSTNAPTVLGNTNLILDNSDTVTTSTPALAYMASSTPGNTGTVTSLGIMTRIWPAGSYLTFASNATNTAVCTIGVSYLPL